MLLCYVDVIALFAEMLIRMTYRSGHIHSACKRRTSAVFISHYFKFLTVILKKLICIHVWWCERSSEPSKFDRVHIFFPFDSAVQINLC